MFESTRNYMGMLEWLAENVQANFHDDWHTKYNSSTIGHFIEWRSKDRESWILRIEGQRPKVYVEIKDEQKELLFLLRWR